MPPTVRSARAGDLAVRSHLVPDVRRGQAHTMRTRSAVGTYGFFDLFLNPVRLFRLVWQGPPGPEAGRADIAAVRAGEGRKVSCFLRGSVDPYPRRLRQGSLCISAQEAHWVPFWSLRRQKLQLSVGAVHVQTRPADRREPHVKKGGGFIPAFWVVTCTMEAGNGHATADFVVPAADAPLVASYFSRSIIQTT